MTHKLGRATYLLASAMVFVSIAPSTQAQDCSLVKAAGHYGFSDSGTVFGVGRRAAAGLLSFDAAGNVQGSVTASLGGNITETKLSGTYTVKSDCSGTASIAEFDPSGDPVLTATVNIAWDDNMREARFIFTSIVLPNGTPLSSAINGQARKLTS